MNLCWAACAYNQAAGQLETGLQDAFQGGLHDGLQGGLQDGGGMFSEKTRVGGSLSLEA